MRAVCTLLLLACMGCGSKSEPTGSTRDYEEYVAELKKQVPLEPAEFKRAGWRAESYVKDDTYPLFREVTIPLDPVRLKNAITGKTQTYRRARLVRNNPLPGDKYHAPEPFAWVKVEMLP